MTILDDSHLIVTPPTLEQLLDILRALPPDAISLVGYVGDDGNYHALTEADLRSQRVDGAALIAEVERLRALCSRAANKLDEFWDEGPREEGWQSDALMALIGELKGPVASS